MKIFRLIVFIFFVINILTSCSNVSSQVEKGNVNIKTRQSPYTQTKMSILTEFRENKIKFYGEWDVGDDSPLFYLVESNENENTFLILDSSGKELYEKKVTDIEKVYYIFALRTEISQLIIEYNEGGNDSFVEMLDYNEGNISELIDKTNGANSFGGGISIQPQFQSNVNPSKEPFEIQLTEYGLPSSAKKFTKILRYRNNRYRYFGKFEREKLDNYKEKIIFQ